VSRKCPGSGQASSLLRSCKGFPRRVAVASGVSAGLLVVATGGWRLAQLVGLTKNPREEDGDHLGFAEITSAATLAGLIIGAGYAIVRPVLPRQPARRPSVQLISSKSAFEAGVLGLCLAETERLFD
jgi:hypothetical protein